MNNHKTYLLGLKIKAIILLLVFLTPFSFKLIHHHHCHENQINYDGVELNIQHSDCDCGLFKFNFNNTYQPSIFKIETTSVASYQKLVFNNYNLQLQFLIDNSKSLRGPPHRLS